MLKLSIIIPVFNEINFLEKFTQKLFNSFKNEMVEYIFVDDGSSDGTSEWLLNFCNNKLSKNCKLLTLKNNIGKGNALHEGIKIAKGEFVLFQDADLELDTNDSLEMLKIISGDATINCLFGSRYLSGKLKKNNNYLNEFIGKFNSLLFNVLFNQSLSDLHCGTKIISRKILNSLNLTIKDFGVEIDLAAQISKNNYDIYEYGISYFARTKKEGKKITWVDGLKSYFYLFKLRFIQNDLATIVSIIYSISYMLLIGIYFDIDNDMNVGKYVIVAFLLVTGLFVGLHRKVFPSTLILFSCYIGSLLAEGNGKIYTLTLGFIVSLYISKKISNFIKLKYKYKIINSLF